jgi:hypothetical protein
MTAAKRLPVSAAAMAMLARLEPAEWSVILPLAAALARRRDGKRAHPTSKILTHAQTLAARRTAAAYSRRQAKGGDR